MPDRSRGTQQPIHEPEPKKEEGAIVNRSDARTSRPEDGSLNILGRNSTPSAGGCLSAKDNRHRQAHTEARADKPDRAFTRLLALCRTHRLTSYDAMNRHPRL